MRQDVDDLTLVLLCWREAPAMLERHVSSVAAALPAGFGGRVLLVENDAAPETSAVARDLVRQHLTGARRQVLRFEENAGFARAMDVALAQTDTELAVLLNSDGRPAPGMFLTLARALDAEPSAVAAAPGIHGPGEPDHPPGPPYADVEVHGMALLLRRERFLSAGGFDPAFFFYGEDHDASARLRAAGHVLLRVPDARFDHGKGGRDARASALREWLFARGEQRRALIHGGPRPVAAARLARSRARALRDHVLERDLVGAAAIAAALPDLPRAALLAERRRRRPWDGEQLAAWLRDEAPRPVVEEL